MKKIDIIVPVKNEAGNLAKLVVRINKAFSKFKKRPYNLIFINDRSTDKSMEVLKKLQKKYKLKVYNKKGEPGKAYCILEGAAYSKSEYICMVDADLQYPPEAIPQMLKLTNKFGVVVGERSENDEGVLRKFLHHGYNFVFNNLLHGLKTDVQSGLKIFKKEIIENIDSKNLTSWTFDLSLLVTAKQLGYQIGGLKIKFDKRVEGKSKVNIFKTSIEIGLNSLKLKFNQKKAFLIPAKKRKGMVGAGFKVLGKEYITHSTLDPNISAIHTFHPWQSFMLILIFISFLLGLIYATWATLILTVGILTLIYFLDVVFNLFVVLKSMHYPPEIRISQKQIKKINHKKLPIFTILCPLYKEAEILPHFIKSIKNLDWPKNKLDVIILLEEDDQPTIQQIKNIRLPKYFHPLIIPDSQPKTKPKACNYGLNFAKGEYLVIYDAEDIPEKDQLKKAYLGFQGSDQNVVCLQSKLNYYNLNQNLLTKFFTAEYSLWFDIILTGLQSIKTIIPLGGTSNIFKTKILKQLKGWDPFNVTEDCDLGVRLYKSGYKTAIIDSTTYEEANSNTKNWLRQRSRWIKGYLQTFFVHTRNPWEFVKSFKLQFLVFLLIIGARISFMLINPFLWLMTISYFLFYEQVGLKIESIFPPLIFYMAVFSLIFGNFLYIYNYMIGAAKRGQWHLIKYVFLVPGYWLLASVSSVIAFYQLLTKPHYWEKTIHGLHLKDTQKISGEIVEQPKPQPIYSPAGVPKFSPKHSGLKFTPGFFNVIRKTKQSYKNNPLYFSGTTFVLASILSNFTNFLFNAYLGRQLSLVDFGNLTLFTSLLYLTTIPFQALSNVVTYKIAYFIGSKKSAKTKGYLKNINSYLITKTLLVTLFWTALIPVLEKFFHVDSVWPFLIFSPVWIIGIYSSTISGYLKGKLAFAKGASLLIIESLSRLVLAVLLVNFNLSAWVYISIPLSMLTSLLLAWFFIRGDKASLVSPKESKFDWSFGFVSILQGISTISFLGLDILLVKHFMSAEESGQYALLSLLGKMTFFFGSLLAPFLLPVVSKNEGAKKSSRNEFKLLFGLTLLFTLIPYVFLGLFGDITAPLFLGEKAGQIINYLFIYILSITLFTLTKPVITYFQAKKDYTFAIAGFIASIIEIFLLALFHQDLSQVVLVIFTTSLLNIFLMFMLLRWRSKLKYVFSNIADFFDLFTPTILDNKNTNLVNQKKVLILNWRDTKHIWAGGAEIYIHEITKRWVMDGYQVTMFCGNDGLQKRNEVIDGINIFRRGGFYTVYLWAFLYYIIKFRGKFDVIIDCENGVPFFSPLYSRKPIFLVIHHVHQEVFRPYLKAPLSFIASIVEGSLMPIIYKNKNIITVSESSKKEISNLKLFSQDKINVIHNGINQLKLKNYKKTTHPSICYVGRLKPYKQVEIAIKAFSRIIKKFGNAKFYIAGEGESKDQLKALVNNLKLDKKVLFLGKISEQKKYALLSKSWLMVQPSMVEGWGITVIEANACGTCVVASNVNGLKDSVKDNVTGFLVENKNVNQFAKTISSVFQNKKLRDELSKNAYVWSKSFSWDKSSSIFLNLINQNIIEKTITRLAPSKAVVKG